MKKTIAKTIIQPKTSTALSLLRVACLFVQLRQVVVGCCASWLIAAAHLLERNLRTFTAVAVDQRAALVNLARAAFSPQSSCLTNNSPLSSQIFEDIYLGWSNSPRRNSCLKSPLLLFHHISTRYLALLKHLFP